MGRVSVKENKNIYQLAREEKGWSRERAAEELGEISKDRLERIENGDKPPRPEEVVAMAVGYNKNTLCNYYCSNQCPIGVDYVPEIKIKDLSQIVLEMLSSLNSMNMKKEKLIDIAVDGKINDEEIDEFIRIQEELEKISVAVETLQLWTEKMLDTGGIDAAKYYEKKNKL